MKQMFLGIGLSCVNLVVVGGILASTIDSTAHAQGTNGGVIEKPNRAVACPSGWRTPDGNTRLCEPTGSLAPKIYGKKESDSCASGYYEVYRLWCSTKRP